jgi:hypothetical protein
MHSPTTSGFATAEARAARWSTVPPQLLSKRRLLVSKVDDWVGRRAPQGSNHEASTYVRSGSGLLPLVLRLQHSIPMGP